MNIDRFWDLVDAARYEAGDRIHPEFPERFLAALRSRLDAIDLVEVMEYDARRIELSFAADRPGLRAVNRMVAGTTGYSDEVSDGFAYGLISLGRGTFERALAEPDSLSWEPLFQAIAQGRVPSSLMILEELPALAQERYEERDEQNVDYEAALDTYIAGTGDIDEPAWETDPGQVRQRLPKLSAMFGERLQTVERQAIRERRWSKAGWALLFAAILVAAIVISIVGQAMDNQP